MLIMCLFSLSAILAPVLIAIYILQPFTLGKEPTLMVPNWQNGAVKRLTICCLLRRAWSALQPVCARVCICVPARVRVVCRGAGGPAPWCACVVRACAGVAREAGEKEALRAFLSLLRRPRLPGPPLPLPRAPTARPAPGAVASRPRRQAGRPPGPEVRRRRPPPSAALLGTCGGLGVRAQG